MLFYSSPMKRVQPRAPGSPGTGYPVMKGRCLGLNFRALLLRAGFFRGHLIGISSPILSGFLALKRQSKGLYTIWRPQNCKNHLKMGQVAMGSDGNRELQTELQWVTSSEENERKINPLFVFVLLCARPCPRLSKVRLEVMEWFDASRHIEAHRSKCQNPKWGWGDATAP